MQFERIGNDVADIEQKPHVTVYWNQSLTTLAGAVERGNYGYWSWRQFGTLGKVNVNNLGPLLPGRVDGQQQADPEPRHAHRKGSRAVLPREP